MLNNISCKYRSIVKPDEPDKYCEDRIRVEKKTGLFALADGAGGQGVFAGEWAEYLLGQLPAEPFCYKKEFTQWHRKIRISFYEKKLKFIQKEIPDIEEKFIKEGASCTLLVLWIKDNKASLLSCGDSALFVQEKENFRYTISYPEFMEHPYLVSCKEDFPEDKILMEPYECVEETHFILSSDALAQYILAAYLFTHPSPENDKQLQEVEDDYVGLSQYTIDLRKTDIAQKDFEKDILDTLFAALETDKLFKDFLYKLHEEKLLNYDDYSLIYIK